MSQQESETKTEAAAPAAERKTRLLKDVEAEENRYIYDALYKSLDDATDESIRAELGPSETLQAAKEAKREFFDATGLPVSEKAKKCAALMAQLSHGKNRRVAAVFVWVSVLMLTLPVILLVIGMHVVAPRLGVDGVLCGGFLSLGGAITIMAGYTIYALVEDAGRSEPTPAPEATSGTTTDSAPLAEKKKQ